MSEPSVDIVILNYNGKKYLDECLKSVLNSTYKNKHVYLLDNASPNDDVDYVKANYKEVAIIQNPLNNGYCAAYNLAFKYCTSKYIICLNNDVTVDKHWLEPMINMAQQDETIAAIQPKLVSYYNHQLFEYAGASGGLMDKYGFPFLRGRIFTEIEEDKGQYNTPKQVFWTTGAAMFLRREALNTSGLLDETIVHHMDEIDLCWRLRMCGYKLLVEPTSVVHHIGGATIQTNSFKKVYWNHRNAVYIMLKNYELKNVIKYVPFHLLLDYVFIAQNIVTGKFNLALAVFKAHLWLIKNFSLITNKRKLVQTNRTITDKEVLKFLYPKSIVLEFFLQKHKTINELNHNCNYEYKLN